MPFSDYLVPVAAAVAIYISVLMLLALWRALVGPTVVDRMISVNQIGTKAIVVLLLIGVLYGRLDMFVDISIAYGLLNFLATIATARYFTTRDAVAPEEGHLGEDAADFHGADKPPTDPAAPNAHAGGTH
jgi:multicomponent Na+:H+ antiporter subunit F